MKIYIKYKNLVILILIIVALLSLGFFVGRYFERSQQVLDLSEM